MGNEKDFTRLYLNLDLINKRAADIRKALQLLAQYATIQEEDFLADETILAAAKYQLLVAIEAAQAICNHLAARVARKAPTSYAECFLLLTQSSVITRELATRLAVMAKFRNLLVHQYADIDNKQVYAIINHELGDLEDYVAQIARFVNGVLEHER
jgi:uncharacterized protein YutE (UPF0331/DUF86 family)